MPILLTPFGSPLHQLNRSTFIIIVVAVVASHSITVVVVIPLYQANLEQTGASTLLPQKTEQSS